MQAALVPGVGDVVGVWLLALVLRLLRVDVWCCRGCWLDWRVAFGVGAAVGMWLLVLVMWSVCGFWC